MPLLYGEGNNAFQRLFEEIIRATDDPTILLQCYWDRTEWVGLELSRHLLTRYLRLNGRAASRLSTSGPGDTTLSTLACDGENNIKDIVRFTTSFWSSFTIAVFECIFEDDSTRMGKIITKDPHSRSEVYQQNKLHSSVRLRSGPDGTITGTPVHNRGWELRCKQTLFYPQTDLLQSNMARLLFAKKTSESVLCAWCPKLPLWR